MTFQQVWTMKSIVSSVSPSAFSSFWSLFIFSPLPSSVARQGEPVRGNEVFFLSSTQGGRWRTFKGWWEMFIFLKNRHVYFIIGWLVALIVNTCNTYICELRWGMNTLVWSLTRQSGLESPIKRSPQFLLNDDILMLSSISWLLLSCLFLSPLSGSGFPVPIQPDGRRLDAQPPTKCDATKGRWLCQSWVSIICFFLDNNLYPVPRTGPLCQCHVIQQAYQWVHHHKCII